jgi:hypothetical protein
MPLTSLDFEQIRQLIARYCHALLRGDVDDVVGCFAPEGFFDNPPEGHPSTLKRRYEGRKELAEFANLVLLIFPGNRLWCVNTLINGVADDVAEASTFCLITHSMPPHYRSGDLQPPSAELVSTGMYYDRMVKRDEQWLIAERRFRWGEPTDT